MATNLTPSHIPRTALMMKAEFRCPRDYSLCPLRYHIVWILQTLQRRGVRIIIAEPRVLTRIRSHSADCLQGISASNNCPQPRLFEMPRSILLTHLSTQSLKTSSTRWHRSCNKGESKSSSKPLLSMKGPGQRIHDWRTEARHVAFLAFSFVHAVPSFFPHSFFPILIFHFLVLLLSALNAVPWQELAKCSLITCCTC